MGSKGLIINEDVWELIDDLLPKEQNELLKCLAAYHRGEDIPAVSRAVLCWTKIGWILKKMTIKSLL